MDKILTIAIPTYNRRRQLMRLLKSIESQKCTDLYNIIISDNCSNYSVEEAINEEFDGEFVSNIKVVHRDFNAGGDYNISSVFTFSKSELFWVVGDDDELVPDSIRTVIDKYNEHPECAFYKYAINEQERPDKDVMLHSVRDLKEQIKKGKFLGGDVIFLSNNVYNIRLIHQYLGDCLYYTYCSAPHVIPMLYSLLDDDKMGVLCRDIIVKYNAPEGDHWNYVKITTSLGSFLDINYGNKHDDIADFFYLMCGHFGLWNFVLECLNIKDRKYRRYIYSKGMLTVFARKRSLLDYIARIMFFVDHYSRLPIMSKFCGFLYNKQNEIQSRLKEKALYDDKTKKLVLFLKKYMPRLK